LFEVTDGLFEVFFVNKSFENGFVCHFEHVSEKVGDLEAVVLYFIVTGGHDNAEALGGLCFV
jgi:hypothetical protein